MDKVGLDAVTFLRFLRMMRWLFTGIAVLGCGILIPINVYYNLKHVDKEGRDILSMLTIRDVSGNILFAHVAVTYLITFLIIGFVFIIPRGSVSSPSMARKDLFHPRREMLYRYLDLRNERVHL